MGCYRKDEAADPEIYIASAARVFMAFPLYVARTACDPVRGIPGKVQWLPSVAEIKAFCDRLVAERMGEANRQQQLAEQLRRRALPPPADDEARDRAIENVVSRFGPRWGLNAEQVGRATLPADEACMAALGLTREQFDALQDADAAEASPGASARVGSFTPLGAAARPTLRANLEAKAAIQPTGEQA